MSRKLVEVEAALGQRHLSEFVKICWPEVDPAKLIWEPHLDEVCKHLEAVFHYDIAKLIINIPPSLSKSLLTNVFFPAWAWTVDPTFRIGFVTNDISLARRDARKCRRLIEGDFYQRRWPLPLIGDANRIEEFANVKEGVRQCFTIRRQITGHHFHCICVDDPHKPQAFYEGEGRTDAERASYVYDDVLPTRYVDPEKKRFILIMQRLAENDLTGHILDNDPDDVEHLCLPMEYVPEKRCATSIGGDWRAYEGELLAPKRFSKTAVEKTKRSFRSPRVASAQFQQDPIPDDGVIFKAKYFKYEYDELPDNPIYYLSFDCNFKEADTSDYVVGTVWALADSKAHLVDMVRGRWGFTNTLRQTLTLVEKYPSYRGLLIEEKANGAAIIDALSRSEHGKKIVPVNPGSTSKIERAFATTPMFENGFVVFPKKKPVWWTDYYKEMLAFPSGKNDDIVDSSTQLLLYLGARRIPNMQKVFSNMKKMLPA